MRNLWLRQDLGKLILALFLFLSDCPNLPLSKYWLYNSFGIKMTGDVTGIKYDMHKWEKCPCYSME